MHQSTFLKHEELEKVSKNVLRLINNKKYPLHQERLKAMKNKKAIIYARKAITCIDQNLSMSSFQSRTKSKIAEEIAQKSIGEHFSEMQTKNLLDNFQKNQEFQNITQKLNHFIWDRKKEIKEQIRRSKSLNPKGLGELRSFNNTRNRKSQVLNIQRCLEKMRKKMKEELSQQNVNNTTLRFSELYCNGERQRTQDFNFLEEDRGIEMVMKRYPLKLGIISSNKISFNQQLEKDMMQQFKQTLPSSCNKFSRMRIGQNHKKMVSLR